MSWQDLLWIRVRGLGLDVHVGVLFLVVVALLALAGFVASRRTRTWRVARANFTFAGCGQVEICPDNEVARIAHQAWVELKTRKAAIPIDPNNDVISEVYDSWYELFRSLRELTKTIPPESVRAIGDAPILSDVLMRALNEGLRPHLTTWQARFRKWFEAELANPDTRELSPQEIQRQFPEYDRLVTDMVAVNAALIEFAEELRKLAHERRRSFSLRQLFRRRASLDGL